MIPIDVIVLFLGASVALALAPGPDNIYVLTQSALHGWKAGIVVTMGLCSGLIVHTGAVALGVAAIFQTSASAFNLLKWVGAAYLLYQAWQAFRARSVEVVRENHPAIGTRGLYLKGVVMNLTNPKIAVFFLAFLPQFTDSARGSISIQMLVLGGMFIIVSFFVFSLISWFAGFLGVWLKRSTKAQVVMNRIAGAVFASLALRLAMSER